jgi:hypothetical protein
MTTITITTTCHCPAPARVYRITDEGGNVTHRAMCFDCEKLHRRDASNVWQWVDFSTYAAIGEVDGACSHRHRSLAGARACLARHATSPRPSDRCLVGFQSSRVSN